MGSPTNSEHFIPVSQKVVFDQLMSEGKLTDDDRTNFRRFYDILRSLFHFEFHSLHEELKDSYHAFDPDPVTPAPHVENKKEALNSFDASISALMERANFTPLSKKDLDDAFASETPLAVKVTIDLNKFELLHLFSRGKTKKKEKVSLFGPIKKTYELELYNRLVMLAKFVPQKRRWNKATVIGQQVDHEKVYLKYFKNVPVPDIEMIFPDPKIKMGRMDRFNIAIPILIGIGTAAGQFLGLVSGSYGQSVTISIGAILGLYISKTIITYQNTKTKYVKNLTQGLYFKNLDNNSGVFDAIINEAEEEEVKEAILAYYFLHTFGAMDEQTLDKVVEEWFKGNLNLELDFEVDDALHKLERLELASQDAEEKWHVVPLSNALERLDYLWDNYFDYNSKLEKVEVPPEVPITSYREPEQPGIPEMPHQ
jgi:hypothetical protein